MFSKKIGDLLLRARKELKISREELARRGGVSTRLVAELERGQRPNVSLESTLNLLNLVGVSVVAKRRDGSNAEIKDTLDSAAERAMLRRRTWTGRHINLHDEGGAPYSGRSHEQRLSALSQISAQAFAFSRAADKSPGRRSR